MSAGALNVAVLGAGGTIARAIVRDLAESEEVAGLLALDVDGERAAQVAAQHGGGRARAAAVDAREGLAPMLAGSDVLVNAASYRLNLVAMRAALDADCDYVDLGGLYWMTSRQLELHERFQRAGRLAVLGMGSSPGKTNVMAVRAVRALGGQVHALHVAAAARDPEPTAALRAPYALRTLLDELTMAPVVLDEGEPRELEPLAPGGIVRFPDPIGEVATIHTLHSELRTFGPSFGVQEASFRLSLARELQRRLEELRDAAERGARGGAGRVRGAVGARRLGARRRGERGRRACRVRQRPDRADGRVGARRRRRLDGRAGGGARPPARPRPGATASASTRPRNA